jgi:hypothetical protein
LFLIWQVNWIVDVAEKILLALVVVLLSMTTALK